MISHNESEGLLAPKYD